METKTYTIPNEFILLQNAASDDVSRYNINGVYFNEKVAVATDGHIMAVRKKPDDIRNAMPDNLIVNFDCKKIKDESRLWEQNNKRLTHVTSPKNIGTVVEDATYPDYKVILPTLGSNAISITIDHKLLSRLAMAINSLDKKDAGITLQFNPNEQGPILVSGSDKEVIGIIMPMRHEGASPSEVLNNVLS